MSGEEESQNDDNKKQSSSEWQLCDGAEFQTHHTTGQYVYIVMAMIWILGLNVCGG
jgi:hypothetical protein